MLDYFMDCCGCTNDVDIYIYIYIVFTTEGFFEVAIESWSDVYIYMYIMKRKEFCSCKGL